MQAAHSSLVLLALFLIACRRERPELGRSETVPDGPIPSGLVMAFAGNEIPAGWTVCDGRTTPTGLQTPDLRGRFVLGTEPGPAVGQPGGSEAHVHVGTTGPGDGSRLGADRDNDVYPPSVGHRHSVELEPASHLPPHVRLVYLMKD